MAMTRRTKKAVLKSNGAVVENSSSKGGHRALLKSRAQAKRGWTLKTLLLDRESNQGRGLRPALEKKPCSSQKGALVENSSRQKGAKQMAPELAPPCIP